MFIKIDGMLVPEFFLHIVKRYCENLCFDTASSGSEKHKAYIVINN